MSIVNPEFDAFCREAHRILNPGGHWGVPNAYKVPGETLEEKDAVMRRFGFRIVDGDVNGSLWLQKLEEV